MIRRPDNFDEESSSENISAWLGRRFPRLTLGIVVIALFTTLTLIFLIYIFDLFPTRVCNTVEECAAKADQMASAGKFEPALKSLDAALALAEGKPQPPHAYLWCRKGDILLLTGDEEAALQAFQTCLAWSGDDAAFESMRTYARERIEQME